MPYNFVSHTAKGPARKAGVAVGAHNNQVYLVLFGVVEYLVSGLALTMAVIGFLLTYFISATYVKIRRGYILNPF